MNLSIAKELKDELLRLGAISYVPFSSQKGFFIIKLPNEHLTFGQKMGELTSQEKSPTVRGIKPVCRHVRKYECTIYDNKKEIMLRRSLSSKKVDGYLKRYRKKIDEAQEFLISGVFKGKTKLIDITKGLEPGTAIIDASKCDGNPTTHINPILGHPDKFTSLIVIFPNQNKVNATTFSHVEYLITKDKIHSKKYLTPINDFFRDIGLLNENRKRRQNKVMKRAKQIVKARRRENKTLTLEKLAAISDKVQRQSPEYREKVKHVELSTISRWINPPKTKR